MIKLNKKILIITTWAPPMIGGPMNLYNIFSQFPKDSYYILTGYSAITTSPHKTEYWLEGKYIFYDRPEYNGTRGKQEQNKPKQKEIEKQWWNYIINFILKIFYFKGIGQLLIMILQIFTVVSRGLKTVKKEKIDILMGISGDGLAMISTYLIHKFNKKPYTLWLFDIYHGNNFITAIKWLANKVEPILFKHASKIFLTNEGTVDLYKKRYGSKLPYEIIYNSVFPENYQKQHTHYNPKPPYTILLTGHIYWPQEQSVLNLIAAIKIINTIKTELKLFSPTYPKSIEEAIKGCPNIIITSAPPEEMPTIQSKADLLFLPLSWDTPSPEIIATATPGKFTDYLASGRPMLVHAPDYAYVSKYAKKNQLGLVIDKNDVQLLADTIQNFFKNPTIGQQYINNALKIFYQNHDARKNAQKLIKLLKMV